MCDPRRRGRCVADTIEDTLGLNAWPASRLDVPRSWFSATRPDEIRLRAAKIHPPFRVVGASRYRTGFRWQRSQSLMANATLVWQTPQPIPEEISIIEVFFVPAFVLG
jgi:hypothetical protein